MAAALKEKYKDKLEDVNLIASSGGAFEISVDGKLMYSKLKTGRFPEEKEIIDAINKAI